MWGAAPAPGQKWSPRRRSVQSWDPGPGGWHGSHCGATPIEFGGNVSSRVAGKAVHGGVLLGRSLTEPQRGALASTVCRALLATVHWRSWAWEAPALWAWGSWSCVLGSLPATSASSILPPALPFLDPLLAKLKVLPTGTGSVVRGPGYIFAEEAMESEFRAER